MVKPVARSRPWTWLVVLLLGGLSACSQPLPEGRGLPAGRWVSYGGAFADFLATSPSEGLDDGEIVAAGYLERARLGLSSPFRLMDFALHDPLLTPELRGATAYALLARTARGRVYQVDPGAMAAVPLGGVAASRAGAEQQLELVARSVALAATAQSGERTVRVGYELAAAEGSVTAGPEVPAHVAALLADRRRAAADALALLRAAEASGAPLPVLLGRWRSAGLLSVEAPDAQRGSARDEAAAAAAAPRLALALRALGQRLGAPLSLVPEGEEGAGEPGYLDGAKAERLWRLARARDYPPQSSIAVAELVHRPALLDALPDTGQAAAWTRALADSAWNEERFAAALAALRARGAVSPRVDLLQVQAAVFMRGWNQEAPWFPGDPAPAVKDVVARYGLARIDFDAAVPSAWRPYLLRGLMRGLADVQRVLPTASVRGLTVHFGALPVNRPALALHDPRTRTLYLPPRTGAGTLAHEIAHDLDWQLARRRFLARAGYATDLAVRERPGDRIAYALSDLASSITPPDSGLSRHDTRPAEILARGTDWLVAVTLARQGRDAGYVSSYQDALLTGYGTTRAPELGGEAVPALLSILDEISPVPDSTRSWALATFGPSHSPSPAQIARAIVRAGAQEAPERRFQEIARARDRALAALDAPACRAASEAGQRRLLSAERALVQASAAAAARGVALRAALERTAAAAPGHEAAAREWLAWQFYGAPEPADSALAPLEPELLDLAVRARALEAPVEGPLVSPFRLSAPMRLCGGNPFASPTGERPLVGR